MRRRLVGMATRSLAGAVLVVLGLGVDAGSAAEEGTGEVLEEVAEVAAPPSVQIPPRTLSQDWLKLTFLP